MNLIKLLTSLGYENLIPLCKKKVLSSRNAFSKFLTKAKKSNDLKLVLALGGIFAFLMIKFFLSNY